MGKILRKRKIVRGCAIGMVPNSAPGTTTVLSAREQLNAILEFKEVDLGYSYDIYPEVACSSDKKKHFPSLSIYDRDTDIDLPLEGTAKVKFKLRSKTVRQDETGKKRHSADIEIQSIDPMEEKVSKKPVEGQKATLMSARKELDVIRFGVDPIGLEATLAKLRKLHPEAFANHFKKSEAILAKKLKPGRLHPIEDYRNTTREGDMLAAFRRRKNTEFGTIELGILDFFRRKPVQIGSRLLGSRNKVINPTFVSPTIGRLIGSKTGQAAKGWYPERAFSAREELNAIIQFDPRPRNTLGEFSGAEEGPNPNAIGVVYKQPIGRTVSQNLAGGAVAGVGATTSGLALKALINKLKKQKV